jgi:hypothetical protein
LSLFLIILSLDTPKDQPIQTLLLKKEQYKKLALEAKQKGEFIHYLLEIFIYTIYR